MGNLVTGLLILLAFAAIPAAIVFFSHKLTKSNEEPTLENRTSNSVDLHDIGAQVIESPHRGRSPFLQGVNAGIRYGLGFIAKIFLVVLALEVLAFFYGGSTKTYWELFGLVLSVPWSILFTYPKDTIQPLAMFYGTAINLLLLGVGWGIVYRNRASNIAEHRNR
jgi:hypothetical protein